MFQIVKERHVYAIDHWTGYYEVFREVEWNKIDQGIRKNRYTRVTAKSFMDMVVSELRHVSDYANVPKSVLRRMGIGEIIRLFYKGCVTY